MISAGVITAKVVWNMKNTGSGRAPTRLVRGDAPRKVLARSPNSGPVPEKAMLYPRPNHSTEPRQAMATHCIITDRTFFCRTRPP